MEEYTMYRADDLGIDASPADGETAVVLIAKDKKAYLTYVTSEDPDRPPYIIVNDMTEVTIPAIEVPPVFPGLTYDKWGTIHLRDESDVLLLTEKQNETLGYPLLIETETKKYYTYENHGGAIGYLQDYSLSTLKPVRLDYMEVVRAIKEKDMSALLDATHYRCGNTFPTFPCGMYYEKQNKNVVCLTMSQLSKVKEEAMDGREAYFRDTGFGEMNAGNTYGILLIDDTKKPCSVRLVTPRVALELWDRVKERGVEIGR